MDAHDKLEASMQAANIPSDIDELIDALDTISNRRRIYIIYLLDTHGEMTRTELVEHLTEFNNRNERIDAQARKNENVAVYQTHLPRLEREHIVDWERGSDKITKGEWFEEVAEILSGVLDDW